jgi:hypothetical protein
MVLVCSDRVQCGVREEHLRTSALYAAAAVAAAAAAAAVAAVAVRTATCLCCYIQHLVQMQDRYSSERRHVDNTFKMLYKLQSCDSDSSSKF